MGRLTVQLPKNFKATLYHTNTLHPDQGTIALSLNFKEYLKSLVESLNRKTGRFFSRRYECGRPPVGTLLRLSSVPT